MKQIGTPISSLSQGLGSTTFFAVASLGFAYKAYYDNDIWAGISCAGCLAITALAANNFIASLFNENADSNIIGDTIDYSLDC